jgi:hypothetical protein
MNMAGSFAGTAAVEARAAGQILIIVLGVSGRKFKPVGDWAPP